MKTLLILLLLCSSVYAQQIEYGKPSELKGVSRIFIDTGMDLDNRTRIIKEIEKAKLPLTILDSVDDSAEVVLYFRGEKQQVFGKGTGRAIHVGKGEVLMRRGENVRVLLSIEGAERKVWDDKPATNFGKLFVKEFKKANGIK